MQSVNESMNQSVNKSRIFHLSPMLPKRLRLYRTQITRAGPGSEWWRQPRQETADFANTVIAHNESLKEMGKLSAQFIHARSCHNSRPELECQPFTSILSN
jgi:hypothetical protein